MPSYAWDSFSLSFDATCDSLRVIEDASNEVVRTFGLGGDTPLKIGKSDQCDAWSVEYVSNKKDDAFSVRKYDTLSGAEFIFIKNPASPRLIGKVRQWKMGCVERYKVAYALSRTSLFVHKQKGSRVLHITIPAFYSFKQVSFFQQSFTTL